MRTNTHVICYYKFVVEIPLYLYFSPFIRVRRLWVNEDILENISRKIHTTYYTVRHTNFPPFL